MSQFDFYYGKSLGELLLKNVNNFSAVFQSKHMSAAEGRSMALKSVSAMPPWDQMIVLTSSG